MMTDSAICYSINPEPEDGERIGIWDELQMGKAHRLGWRVGALPRTMKIERGTPSPSPRTA